MRPWSTGFGGRCLARARWEPRSKNETWLWEAHRDGFHATDSQPFQGREFDGAIFNLAIKQMNPIILFGKKTPRWAKAFKAYKYTPLICSDHSSVLKKQVLTDLFPMNSECFKEKQNKKHANFRTWNHEKKTKITHTHTMPDLSLKKLWGNVVKNWNQLLYWGLGDR